MSDKDVQNSELAKALKLLIQYANNKGQIHSAIDFSLLKTVPSLYKLILRKYEIKYGIKFKKELYTRFDFIDKIVDDIVKLSVHEPSYYNTVWQKALESLSSINQQTTIMVEQQKKIKALELRKK